MSSKKPSKNVPKAKRLGRAEQLEAMRQASDQDLIDTIRARLALPVHMRTNFLRVRLPNGGSTL